MTRVTDLTIDELMARFRDEIRQLVHEAVREALKDMPGSEKDTLLSLDDFPVDDLGPWLEGITLRREEIYNDDGG